MRSIGWILALPAVAAVASLPTGAVSAQQPQAVRQTEQGIELDFQDTELRLVLTALAEAGRLNLVSGELPARRITLRTNQPVRREDIVALLRSLAASNGLRVTEDGPFLRVEVAETGAALRAAAGRADTAAPER